MEDILKIVRDLIPEISQSQIALLESKFDDIGVSCIDNLSFVTVNDLTDILKLVPARRFISDLAKRVEGLADAENSSETSCYSTYQTDNSTKTWPLHNSSQSSASTSFSEDYSTNSSADTELPFWAHDFEIPWNKFPKEFLDSCENKERPCHSLRQEAVRILCYSIRDFCKKPTSKDIHVIAAKFVSKYKESLSDSILGRVIGSGYTSLMSSIVDRLNNLNRTKTNQNSSSSPSHLSKRYGCVQWSVDIENEDDCNEKKEWMKKEFEVSKTNTCDSTISEYMLDTYALQRKLLNDGASIQQIQEEFPYLFVKKFLIEHFNRLTAADLENYLSEKKRLSILHFLRREKTPAVKKEIAEMDAYVKESYNHFKLIGFIKVVMAYFKEESLLEFYQPCTDTKQIESVRRTDGAPVIAVIGNLYSPLLHHVVVENTIVATVDTLDDAVMIMFGIYYIFNLEYHPKATQTLEFIQRALVDIHPETGSKKPKKSTMKGLISAKVVTLANQVTCTSCDQ